MLALQLTNIISLISNTYGNYSVKKIPQKLNIMNLSVTRVRPSSKYIYRIKVRNLLWDITTHMPPISVYDNPKLQFPIAIFHNVLLLFNFCFLFVPLNFDEHGHMFEIPIHRCPLLFSSLSSSCF